jgi:hypothetical protein
MSDNAEDQLLWETILWSIPMERRNWLNAPWIVTEFYFYRRIAGMYVFMHMHASCCCSFCCSTSLCSTSPTPYHHQHTEAFKYFETGYDMFKKQKQAGLSDAMPFVEQIARVSNRKRK